MTDKQARFVTEYLIDLDATQAAVRAGYSPKTAGQQAYQLLQNTSVAAAVRSGKAKQLAKADLSAARVLEELRRLAFTDFRAFYDATGNLKPIKEWTAEQGSQLASFDVRIKNIAAGDGVTDTIHQFKLWDKVKSLELLAKHFALLTDVVKVTTDDAKLARLAAGRLRGGG